MRCWVPVYLVTAVFIASIAIILYPTGVLADDHSVGDKAAPVLEPLTPSGQLSGQDTVILAARLTNGAGEAMAGQPVQFFLMTSIFGERLMQVGQSLTDATGVASLPYKPSWTGEQAVVLRFADPGQAAPLQASYVFNVEGPVPQHENAEFGLEPVRALLPFAVGAAVLGVWVALGMVVVRIIRGIPAAALAHQPLPEAYAGEAMPPRRTMRPAPLGSGLVLLGAAALLMAPVAWFVMDQRNSSEVSLSTAWSDAVAPAAGVSADAPGTVVPAERQLPVQVVQTGAVTGGSGSSEMPTDMAMIDERLFILDSGRGRLLAVTRDGQVAPMFESQEGTATWFGGALAIASHDDKLYIANTANGNILVIAPPGTVEGAIVPQAQPGRQPTVPSGITVTEAGEIWISDAANHQVLELNSNGELLRTVGDGVESSGDYGFSRPEGLTLDEQGNLYVADAGNGLVKMYSPLGIFLGAVGEGRLADPNAVAVDGSGTIFVSDERAAAVLAFDRAGTYLGSIGGEQPDNRDSQNVLQRPHGVQVKDGLLYVVDRLSGLLVFHLIGE